MRILYLIYTLGHGRGGHSHSLDHLSRELGKFMDVHILSLGPKESPVIRSNPYFRSHIYFNGFNFLYLRKQFDRFLRLYRPTILHFFDHWSHSVCCSLVPLHDYKVVLTKCGGPNPKRYPRAKNLILFSQENLEWFKSKPQYQSARLFLIPNRVKPALLRPTTELVPISKNSLGFTFLRISRIKKTYYKSLMDSIRLLHILTHLGVKNVMLYIVGVIEDRTLFHDLSQDPLVKKGLVVFLTDDSYTTRASRMLYLADAVIGIGRGAMEAASLGLPLLTLNAKGDLPVLITEETFADAFRNNFSERSIFSRYNANQNIFFILKMIHDELFYSHLSSFSREVFDKYFNVEMASEKYREAYEHALPGTFPRHVDSDIFAHTLMTTWRSVLKARD